MTDPWELICHHTYSGTPGVVFDHSPGHLSHGEVVGIGAAAFSQNGATTGSGAVRVGQDGERIRVPHSSCWSPLNGLKAEVTVRLDSDTAGLALHLGGGLIRWLLSGFRFNFLVKGRHMAASFTWERLPSTSSQPATVLTKKTGARLGDTIATDIHGLEPNIEVPYDQWVTLGFLHDGLTTIELSIDGVTVARYQTALADSAGVRGHHRQRRLRRFPARR